MDELHIYERGNQVSIMAADRLTASVFDDREDAPFPALSSGWHGAQLALFVPGK